MSDIPPGATAALCDEIKHLKAENERFRAENKFRGERAMTDYTYHIAHVDDQLCPCCRYAHAKVDAVEAERDQMKKTNGLLKGELKSAKMDIGALEAQRDRAYRNGWEKGLRDSRTHTVGRRDKTVEEWIEEGPGDCA